jgi:RNA polymerase sigma-70 factor (ECF subfamily)
MQDDQTLIQQSRRGQRSAFDQLVNRTARLVFAKIVLDVDDRHRAEDLTQEVYLIAWRSIRSLEEPAAFRSWLLAIAASVVADDARKIGRKKRGSSITGPFRDASDESTDPAAAAQNSDERRRALEALRSLPEEYRLPLALRYLAGADYDAIEKQLALSNGALRGLLHRGLNLLRKRMAE